MFTRLVEMKSTPGKSQELADLIDAKAVSSSKSFPAQESAMVQCSNLPFPKGFFRDSRRVECVSQSDKQIEDPYQLLTQRRSQL